MIGTGEKTQGEGEKWQEQQSGQVSLIGNVIEIG